MPSAFHEGLISLFRNRETLAPQLLRRVFDFKLPESEVAREDAADLSQVTPTAYSADLVLTLGGDTKTFGIVVEVQLRIDPRKSFVWPAYGVNLRARHRCPTAVLVVTPSAQVARWAQKAIDLGAGSRFCPLVLSLEQIPIVTEPEEAQSMPELAVLSAIAHGNESGMRAVRPVIHALDGLDPEHQILYLDLVMASLSDAVKKEVSSMLEQNKYEFQSDFARKYIAKGREEGREEGRQEGREEGHQEGHQRGQVSGLQQAFLLQMRKCFGELEPDIVARIEAANVDEVQEWLARILDATSIAEVLDPDQSDPTT